MKKAIFNNDQELEVQSVTLQNGALVIKTISVPADVLEKILSQRFATKSIVVEDELGVRSQPYEGYTEFQGIMHYTGGILGGVLYKKGESIEERLVGAEQAIEQTNTDMKMAVAELTMVIASMQGGESSV